MLAAKATTNSLVLIVSITLRGYILSKESRATPA